MSAPSRILKITAVALSLGLAAAGCGRRGGLEAPPGGKALPGADNSQPEDEPVPQRGIGNPIGQPSEQGRREPIKPPTGPFVLDFLL